MKVRFHIWKSVFSWFDLTGEERRFLLGVLAIALLGLIARHLHEQGKQPDPYQPAGVSATETRSSP